MLENLQKKWGVKGWQFFLIMCTFAVTGTFTAWVSRGITNWIEVEKYSAGWWALKALVLVIGYQVFILIFGFCFGQFDFFWKFEKKLLTSLRILKKSHVAKIAIFASGAGSNADRIISSFSGSDIKVDLVVSNKANAGVLDIAKKNNIETYLIGNSKDDEERLLGYLQKKNISFIILAGYLWKIPETVIRAYPSRIINIHPALLPKFGGKGMYGRRVHEAVLANREAESGITIHYVDEVYDNGEIIFQDRVQIHPDETAEGLAKKIQLLEHQHFPAVIRKIIKAKSPLNHTA